MVRQRYLAQLAFFLSSSILAMGCCGLCSSGGGLFGHADRLQEAILQQETIDSAGGYHHKDASAILREVPLGTPLQQARFVLSRHGFECREGGNAEEGAFLLCKAARRTSWLTADVIRVKLYHQEGTVSSVDVCTFYDGP